jgi:hypothetical protein
VNRTFSLFAVLAAALVAPLAASAAEAETNECINLASCVSVPNTPWVTVPGAKVGFTNSNQGIEEPGTSLWRINCPGTSVPAGRDFNAPEADESLIVGALVPPFNIGITASPAANFYASWQGLAATTYQPLVGCIPSAARSSAAGADAHRLRLRSATHSLAPGQTKTFVHRCGKGEDLLEAHHGVAFYSAAAPGRAELAKVRVKRSERKGRIVVRASTGAFETERVKLQIHALCRR